MSDNSLRTQILAAVIGGIILAVLGWFAGWMPIIGAWIVSAMSAIWYVLTQSVSVPTGLVFSLVMLSLPTLWRISKSFRRQPIQALAQVQVKVKEKEPIETTFSALEHTLLREFAQADGKWLYIDNIVDRIGVKRLLVEQALESLNNRRLLAEALNYLYGPSYRLSTKGRDLVIQLGYV